MPTKKPSPEGPPSPELVLAAIQRANRHRPGERAGVLRSTVKEHLGLSRDGGSTRRLLPVWDALHADGQIEYSRRHGMDLWALTTAGMQRLRAAQRSGTPLPLPESPQHRNWGQGQRAAREHDGRLRHELRAALAETAALLDAKPRPGSDAWYAQSRRLQAACCRMGSATHCLDEWPEPDDARPDVAPERYRGRRNFHCWAGTDAA
jgi:hypothetical protein